MTKRLKSFQVGKIVSNVKNEVDQWAGEKQSYQVPAAIEFLTKLKSKSNDDVKLAFLDSQKTIIGISQKKYNTLLSKYGTVEKVLKHYIKKYNLKFNELDPVIESNSREQCSIKESYENNN